MRIDIHAHYWTTEYLDILKGYGKPDTDTQRGVGAGSGNELAARLKMMDDNGIDMQILSASPQLPYFDTLEHAVHAATHVNDEYAALVEQHPNRFRALAALPMPHVEASLQELRRGMDELGMLGATMASSILGRSVADPDWDPIFAELNARSAVLYVHPAGLGGESSLVADNKLTWMIGAPMEDTIAAMHLILRGIPSKYPNMKIIIGHLGGALSTLMERIDHLYEWEAPGTPERPSIAAKRLWFDTVSHIDPTALRAARDTFGADRLLLGTDFPYQNQYLTEAINYPHAALPADQADAIVNHNLARLLGITA
ncbi:amidohydrolase family protein [Arthrobacter sp. HY1533]|uniref:amidohydrolase family protein n=1 Tax=Arthrobacter sp. HY1533 TaxID=2970919 RepID=UPI0022B9E33C|nr:amidohydrolase family protein [Arthrobacter sp. HY1533]